jgi:hypothetical protein
MKATIWKCAIVILTLPYAVQAAELELQILDGEYWWGGLSSVGHETPYDSSSAISHNMWGDNKGNQAQPLLLSNKGRYVWSEEPIQYQLKAKTSKMAIDMHQKRFFPQMAKFQKPCCSPTHNTTHGLN